jgi:hypothetical protein
LVDERRNSFPSFEIDRNSVVVANPGNLFEIISSGIRGILVVLNKPTIGTISGESRVRIPVDDVMTSENWRRRREILVYELKGSS